MNNAKRLQQTFTILYWTLMAAGVAVVIWLKYS
jgi:predicted nucleic acid-binding Zn ribbon protein